MYRVLIVDDEELIVERMKYGVEWEQMGFEVCGWAYDGQEAWAKIKEFNPDVVITDIRMPIIDGLTLAREIYKEYPKIYTILLSGYAEFEYAQQAMQYEVSGYCLKPLSEEELATVLKKVKQKIDNSLWQHNYLLENGINEPEKLCTILRNNGIDCSKSVQILFGPDCVNSIIQELCYGISCGRDMGMWIFNGKALVELKFRLNDISLKRNLSYGLSQETSVRRGIRGAITEARIAFYQRFINGEEGIQPFIRGTKRELIKILASIDQEILSSDSDRIEAALVSLYIFIKKGEYNIKHVLYAFNYVMESLDGENSYNLNIDHEEELVEHFHTLEQMFDFLKQVSKDDRKSTTGIFDIQEVIGFIEAQYTKDISLQSIANKFFINSDYLCKVFRRETGCNFTRYLTQLRLKHARALLENSDLPISNIAESSGFNNYFYFARVFKQHTKMTPTEYRESREI